VRRWLPLGILAAAQFVMVLDSSVMNVSISQIVADLDTTVTGVQLAITAYTLVMAAFMLVGAKLGDIWGRDRAFAIGLAVYGLGSLTTSLSPNLQVLLIGWSLVEGLGAVLVVPAIAALIAANYEGKQRALAYGVIGGVAGAAVAVGPVIGGWVTTTFSWRLVFVGEVVVVLGILLVRNRMKPAPRPEHPPKLDAVGSVLSALGLGLVVFGILRSSSWGWVRPIDAPTIGGVEITPFGFSVVPFLIVGGVLLLWFFGLWEERRERLGKDTLLDRTLLRIRSLRAGLATLMSQQLVMMGTFFVLPVYLQVVLGLDAFETGKRLLPLSLTLLIAALAGPKLAERLAPRLVVQIGLIAMVVAALVLVGTIDAELNETSFRLALAAGNGPEPRCVARHRPHRLDPACRSAHRLHEPHLGEPRLVGSRAGADSNRDGTGDRDRHDRTGTRRRAGGRPDTHRGGRSHRRLRRRPARSTQEGDARGGPARPPVHRVHPSAARKTGTGRAARARRERRGPCARRIDKRSELTNLGQD